MVVLTRPPPNAPLPTLGSAMNSPREASSALADSTSNQNGTHQDMPGTVVVQVQDSPQQQPTEVRSPPTRCAPGPPTQSHGGLSLARCGGCSGGCQLSMHPCCNLMLGQRHHCAPGLLLRSGMPGVVGALTESQAQLSALSVI